MTFHAKDGWTFRRGPDGSVSISAPIYDDGSNTTIDEEERSTDVTLPASIWASVVASMSHFGETPTTYQEARRFHLGEPR